MKQWYELYVFVFFYENKTAQSYLYNGYFYTYKYLISNGYLCSEYVCI